MSLDSTKADDIALVIEEAIVSGELEPGTVLRQEQLSEQFNVNGTGANAGTVQVDAGAGELFVTSGGTSTEGTWTGGAGTRLRFGSNYTIDANRSLAVSTAIRIEATAPVAAGFGWVMWSLSIDCP